MRSNPSSEQFLNRKKIFLSPHSDDVCFSMGIFAKSNSQACVINVFSVSGYLPGMHGLNQEDAISQVSSIRNLEDIEFARTASLEIESLGLLDAPLRGLDPLQSKPTDQELDYINGALTDGLAKIWSTFGQNSLLLAPMGIGAHVDHLTVRDWVIKNLSELSAKYSVGFYEDLHYASDFEKRRLGIEELFSLLPKPYQASRIRIPIDEDINTKVDLIGIYKSQLPTEVIDIQQFTPAENGSKTPHEAFWSVHKK